MKFSTRLRVLFFCSAFIAHFSSAESLANEGFIKVTGGSVWYKITGSGDKIPLLLIHGGPGGSSCSFDDLAKLGQNRKVIFYDQLGAGKSEQPDDLSLWQINRFVEELDTVRKTLHLQQVHLLAHSWGAAIAGQYLLDKGTKGIASVIFVGPYLSTADWVNDTNELRRQLSPTIQAIMHKHELAGTTASNEYQDASNEFYKLFLFHHPNKNTENCKDSAWNQTIYETMWGDSEFFASGNLKGFNAAKDLGQIKIPTLFLVGEFDEVQESTVYKYQQKMSNASISVIKNAAHMSMIDEPKAFLSTVNNFLLQTDSTP